MRLKLTSVPVRFKIAKTKDHQSISNFVSIIKTTHKKHAQQCKLTNSEGQPKNETGQKGLQKSFKFHYFNYLFSLPYVENIIIYSPHPKVRIVIEVSHSLHIMEKNHRV